MSRDGSFLSYIPTDLSSFIEVIRKGAQTMRVLRRDFEFKGNAPRQADNSLSSEI